MPPYWFQNLGGGRDGGLHPASIRDNQLADVLNLYPLGSKLKRRGGCALIQEWAWGNTVSHSGVFFNAPAGGINGTYVGQMVAGASRIWNSVMGLIPSTLPVPGVGLTLKPWFFAPFRSVLYTVHPGFGSFARTLGASHDRAGIPAPAAACVLADGGAGALAVGTYYDVYTYYNTATGEESNPSPASNGLVLAAGRLINATNITVSPTAQVNARRLYRTFANQQGEYYFVAQINDNVTTVYNNEQTLPTAMGRAVRFDNGDIHSVATAFTGMAIWGSRMWLTDGTYVYYSNLGQYESFNTAESLFQVAPNDGERIFGLYAYGDRLVVMKASKLYYLTGSGPGSFAVYTFSDRHGCPAPYSMKSVGTRLFWFDGTNFCTSEGGAVRTIGETAVRDRLALSAATGSGIAEYIQAAIVPERHQYHACIPTSVIGWYTDGPTGNKVAKFTSEVLVYDYIADAWTRYSFPDIGNPVCIFPRYASYIAVGHFAIFNADTTSRLEYYDRASNTQDNGVDITASLISKAVAGAASGVLRRVHLMMPPYAGRVITLEAFDDGNAGYTVPIKTRANLSIADRDAVKAYNLSTAGRLSRLLQTRMTYTGQDAIELSGIGLEVDEHERLVRIPR